MSFVGILSQIDIYSVSKYHVGANIGLFWIPSLQNSIAPILHRQPFYVSFCCNFRNLFSTVSGSKKEDLRRIKWCTSFNAIQQDGLIVAIVSFYCNSQYPVHLTQLQSRCLKRFLRFCKVINWHYISLETSLPGLNQYLFLSVTLYQGIRTLQYQNLPG